MPVSTPLATHSRSGLEGRFARRATRLGASLTLGLGLALGGCGTLPPVKPWEKGLLAKPEMGFEGDRLETLLVEHTYSSKEAASGGNGVGGGGCGCN